MNKTTYLAILRTHVWDEHVAEIARAARRCCVSGSFLIAADESKEVLPVPDFIKFSHADELPELDLPLLPKGRVLWWNADYPLYSIRHRYPDFDYYVMFEYDVLVKFDVDRAIEICAEQRVDLVVHQLQRIADGSHWSYSSVSELNPSPWQALIPLLIVSARAIDVLFEMRQTMARQLREGAISQWPYCEAFIPTVAMMRNLKIAPVSDFANASLLRYRPFISLRDDRLSASELVAHPVMGGRRFVAAFAASIPPGSHVMSDGFLRRELEREDPQDIQAVFHQELKPFVVPDTVDTVCLQLEDLARDKPATQSSWSKWSRALTAEADACNANSGTLKDDFAFHTDHQLEPWWAVDLSVTCMVEAVEILNRSRLEGRFLHFRIETSMDGEAWTVELIKQDNAMISSYPERPAVFRLAEPVRARHLRIVRLETGFLHLRRVRVLGTTSETFCPTPQSMSGAVA